MADIIQRIKNVLLCFPYPLRGTPVGLKQWKHCRTWSVSGWGPGHPISPFHSLPEYEILNMYLIIIPITQGKRNKGAHNYAVYDAATMGEYSGEPFPRIIG